MPQPDPIELVFRFDTETKNKIRFQEVYPITASRHAGEPVHKDAAVVDKLYVSKKALKKMGNPDTLKVQLLAP